MNKSKDGLEAQVQWFRLEFKEPFELTTYFIKLAIGAVLVLKQRPILFILTLNETEQNYSTNEKELLAFTKIKKLFIWDKRIYNLFRPSIINIFFVW